MARKPKPVDPNLPDCPECKGMGVRRREDTSGRNSTSSRPSKCPDCRGTGKQGG